MSNPLLLFEILELIFSFLSRKDLYKSCTRVDHQWNAVSLYVIRKKRKQDLFGIPGILDNIFSNLDIDYDPFILYTLSKSSLENKSYAISSERKLL